MAGSAPRLGADPDDLQRLAASFDRAARALTDSVARVDRHLGRTGWEGPAAAAFSRRWAVDRTVARAMAGHCTAAATDLRSHAEQQRAAAGAHGGSRTAPLRLTRSESVLRVGGFVDVGPLEGRVALQAKVEELDGARSRVTVSDVVGLAGVAAVGANVEGGCGTSTATPRHPLRAEAEVAAGAEVEHRSVWEVADDDVHGLLAAEGAHRVAAALAPGFGPLVTAVARHLEPDPAGQEFLLRSTVSAGAVSPRLGALGPGATAHAAVSVAVGLATTTGGRTSLVVEAGNEAASRFQPGFLSALPHLERRATATATWLRLEIPQDAGTDRGRPVRVELRSTTPDGTVDRVVVHGRLSDDGAARAAAEQVRRDLSAGRTPSRTAVDALAAGLRGSLVDPVVQADRLEAETLGCAGRSVGGLGGGGGAQVVNLRPRR